MDKLNKYRRAAAPLPEQNRLWPLYGAGFDNLGLDGKPIARPLPQYGPDELLVRHDAVGLCFSDIKIIRLGEDHPRIYRNMKENPVVQGHEVSMTVVGVGENLRDQYAVGDRFIIQADVYFDGVNLAYGYEIQGGLSQYNVIDQLRRKRPHRAVGLRHRGLRAKVPHRVEGRGNDVDYWGIPPHPEPSPLSL